LEAKKISPSKNSAGIFRASEKFFVTGLRMRRKFFCPSALNCPLFKSGVWKISVTKNPSRQENFSAG